MACCILIFGLFSCLLWPFRKLYKMLGRPSPLAWQPQTATETESLKLSVGRFSLTSRARSFKYALQGLSYMVRKEHNARIHVFATVLAMGAGLYFGLSRQEFSLLVLVCMAVIFAETINTAFEHLCDVVSPEFHPSVKFAKDIAAGAVLICAVSAVVIGTTLFGPYIMEGLSAHLTHHS